CCVGNATKLITRSWRPRSLAAAKRKRIQLKVSFGSTARTMTKSPVIGWTREEMAERLAQDIPDGSYVNLGIGIPELVARFVPAGRSLIYHTENGMLGMGPAPSPGEGDPELINAGKQRVTALPGAAYFHHADSFAMIRGGHLDLCVL